MTRGGTVPASPQGRSLLESAARRILDHALKGLRRGHIELRDGAEVRAYGAISSPSEGRARINVCSPRFYRKVAFGGSVGAAEAYCAGWWTCGDVTTLVRIILRNRAVLRRMEGGAARISALWHRFSRLPRRNSKARSALNIAAHYDLGNEFFELFLDDTLTYSCAIFENGDSGLREASIAKLDRICRKLALSSQDDVLEIGCGWGSFAIHAARDYGCRVTTTTISKQQHQRTCQRVKQAGLTDRIRVLLKDYRDLEGQYDKLVSIEMIEAVGHQYYDAFFKTCCRLLRDDGMMLLQAITITDQEYDRARRRTDFIKRFIFPGACLPSVTVICDEITASTDLNLFHLETITPHYATTLQCWRERFRENIERVRQLGYSEPFIRMWEFYFCYCEAAFLERHVGDVQMLLVKPACRCSSLLTKMEACGV